MRYGVFFYLDLDSDIIHPVHEVQEMLEDHLDSAGVTIDNVKVTLEEEE